MVPYEIGNGGCKYLVNAQVCGVQGKAGEYAFSGQSVFTSTRGAGGVSALGVGPRTRKAIAHILDSGSTALLGDT